MGIILTISIKSYSPAVEHFDSLTCVGLAPVKRLTAKQGRHGTWNMELILKRLILFLILVSSFSAFAQASINIPVGDRSYELIDKLSASGLIKTPIIGQRPWTRDYAAKLIKEALDNKDKLTEPLEDVQNRKSYKAFNKLFAKKRFIDAVLKQLTSDFAEELGTWNVEHETFRIHPLSSISTTYTYLNNSPAIIPSNTYGNINANIHPLVANRQGRQYDEGSNFYWETEHSLEVLPYFAAYLRPQFQFRFANSGDDEAHAYIHNLYTKIGINNLEFEVGRDQLLWGQGLHGGLTFSDNARGLDMIKLSIPYPLFGFLKATAVAANFGHEYNPDKTWVLGARIDLNPINWLDIGFNYLVETHSDVSSAKKISADTMLTFKQLRNSAVYGEVLIDDNQKHDLAWMFGVYLPSLDYTGKWSLRSEFERIGKYVYRSNKFNSGWALNTMLLGNIMGPDSEKAVAILGYNFSPISKIEINAGYLQSKDNNDEYHAMNTYSLEVPVMKSEKYDTTRLLLRTSFGWDYVTNKKEADFMAEIGLKINFPEF